MKIGIDFDGTINNLNSMKAQRFKERLGIIIKPHQTSRTSCVKELSKQMSEEEAIAKYEEVRDSLLAEDESFFLALDDAPNILQELAQKHDLFIVTARPQEIYEQMKTWLQHNKLHIHFEKYHSSKVIDEEVGIELSKQEICKRYGYDMLIDDDIRHLIEHEHDTLVRILFQQDADDVVQEHDHIVLARNWNEIYAIISSIANNTSNNNSSR